MNFVRCLALILTFFSLQRAMAADNSTSLPKGPGDAGGGSFNAAVFVSEARELDARLTLLDAWHLVGLDSGAMAKAISTTHVFCAGAGRLEFLRENLYSAYYESKDQTIFIDCEEWTRTSRDSHVPVVLHEYMRVLGKDGSEYGSSSILTKALFDSKRIAQSTYSSSLSRAIWHGDIAGIYQAVEAGADLNDPMYPSILLVVGTSGSQLTQIGGVTDDSRSGPTFSRDTKVSLIHYFYTKGANINLRDLEYGSRQGSTALHEAKDPVVMSTLLDLGGDPTMSRGTLKSGEGYEQPLLDFLYYYHEYPNKAYFRTVVERMLEMGASTDSCFSDRSGCVRSVALKYGDSDLVHLIERYSPHR